MEGILAKCRLCLKTTSKDFDDLFRKDEGATYAEQILDMLSIEVKGYLKDTTPLFTPSPSNFSLKQLLIGPETLVPTALKSSDK